MAYVKIARVFTRIKSKYEKQITDEVRDQIAASDTTDRFTSIKNANNQFKMNFKNSSNKERVFRSEKEFKEQMSNMV